MKAQDEPPGLIHICASKPGKPNKHSAEVEVRFPRWINRGDLLGSQFIRITITFFASVLSVKLTFVFCRLAENRVLETWFVLLKELDPDSGGSSPPALLQGRS